MRSFLVVWVIAFCLVGVGASAVSWYVGKTPPAPPPQDPVAQRLVLVEQDTTTLQARSFTEAEAVQVVGARLPSGPAGEAVRKQLQSSADVTYHSPGHWRVCVDQACWVAHGLGRYAEAENDLARAREGPSAGRQAPTTP